ncbi:ATP-binding protein, partial [Arthrospira platensis SPKY2]
MVREMHFESAIAHVNYHKRAEASEADEVFVSHLAQSLGMAFYRVDAPIFYKGNFQDEARKFRYDWLNKLAQDFDWILTAHHAGDQRETILQKLLRGS